MLDFAHYTEQSLVSQYCDILNKASAQNRLAVIYIPASLFQDSLVTLWQSRAYVDEENRTYFSCPFCSQIYVNGHALHDHLLQELQAYIWVCQISPCNKWFISVENLQAHMTTYHPYHPLPHQPLAAYTLILWSALTNSRAQQYIATLLSKYRNNSYIFLYDIEPQSDVTNNQKTPVMSPETSSSSTPLSTLTAGDFFVEYEQLEKKLIAQCPSLPNNNKECCFCQQPIFSSELPFHLLEHLQVNPWACRVPPCTHTTQTKAAIEKHIQQAHGLSNPSNYYGYKWLTRLPVTSLQEPCVHNACQQLSAERSRTLFIPSPL